jgi:hypothetical protein
VVGGGAEVIGIEFVEAAAGESEPVGGLVSVEVFVAEASQDVTNQRRGQTVSELLLFFIGWSLAQAALVVVRKVDFSLWD